MKNGFAKAQHEFRFKLRSYDTIFYVKLNCCAISSKSSAFANLFLMMHS